VSLRIASVTVDPAVWTAIVPALACDHVLIKNNDSAVLRLRVDDADAATELPISGNTERMIAAPHNQSVNRHRFPAGATAFYLKPDSGVGPVTLVWV
jgi:hypothetical protein